MGEDGKRRAPFPAPVVPVVLLALAVTFLAACDAGGAAGTPAARTT